MMNMYSLAMGGLGDAVTSFCGAIWIVLTGVLGWTFLGVMGRGILFITMELEDTFWIVFKVEIGFGVSIVVEETDVGTGDGVCIMLVVFTGFAVLTEGTTPETVSTNFIPMHALGP